MGDTCTRNLHRIEGSSTFLYHRNFQTQTTYQTAQFWSCVLVQVSGTSFLSVCHLCYYSVSPTLYTVALIRARKN